MVAKGKAARKGGLMRAASMVVFGAGGSIRSSVATMVQSTLGGGILTLPFAMSQAGIIMGIELLLISCVLNFFSGWALGKASARARIFSFSRAVEAISPAKALHTFMDVMTACLILGIMSSSLFVFADSLQDIFESVNVAEGWEWVTDRTVMLGVVTVVIVLPLACIKKVDSLRFTSTLSLLLQFTICVYVIVIGMGNLVMAGPIALEVRLEQDLSLKTLHAFSCVAFAFCNQLQIPYVVEKMKNMDDVRPTLVWTSGILFVFNCLFATAGWLAVAGGAVNGDILRALPKDDLVRSATTVRAL